MRIDLLCSWGGHLQEMLDLKNAWGKYDYRFITYESDRTKAMNDPMVLIHPPWKSVPRFLISLTKAVIKVIFDRPDVLISTGMGYVDVFLFPLCKMLNVYTIYVESGANVNYITGTANIIRRFCDRFVVKWENLAEKIDAEYHGGIF